MRILINTPPLNRLGGVANFYLNLRGYLSNDVAYFYIGRRNSESGILAVFRLIADYLRFIWVLCRARFDIVHLNPSLGPKAVWRDAIFHLIAKSLGRKTIIFMHGWDKTYGAKLWQRGLWFFRFSYFRADAFIVLAQGFKSSLRKMGYSGPVHVMTTTFDADLLSHTNGYRMRPNVKEPFNILFLSRIEHQKGVFEALEAFAILQLKYPNVHMTVAGSGGALEEARQYVKDHCIRNVTFPGYIRGEKKAQVFKEAHCLLFPSWGEGMPITVVEAMAFGLPIITRPVGALADFFRNDEMGFVTESKNPAVFAELVERLLLSPDLWEKMSCTNREYAMRRFAAAHVAERLRDIYQRVASGPGEMKPVMREAE